MNAINVGRPTRPEPAHSGEHPTLTAQPAEVHGRRHQLGAVGEANGDEVRVGRHRRSVTPLRLAVLPAEYYRAGPREGAVG